MIVWSTEEKNNKEEEEQREKYNNAMVTPPLSRSGLAFRHRFINLIWVEPYVSRPHMALALSRLGSIARPLALLQRTCTFCMVCTDYSSEQWRKAA